MRAIGIVVAAWIVLVVLCVHPYAQTPREVDIAIVVDGPWVENAPIRRMFQDEILALTVGEFDVRFPEKYRIEGDWTLEGVHQALDRLLADPDVDLIITLGVLASQDAAQRPAPPKPVIAAIVVDAEIQGLPNVGGTSGVDNFTYLVFPHNVRRDMDAFLDIVSFKRFAIICSKPISDAIPDLVSRTRSLLTDLEPACIPVDRSIDDALEQLTPDIEAVYVAPLLHLPESEFERLMREINRRKLPSFSVFGEYGVQHGALASLNTDIMPRLSRRVALSVQRILLGENAGDLQTAFRSDERLTVNVATAREIGVYPSWAVLTDAVLVNDVREDVQRVVSIESAVQEALAANLDLAARNNAVEAAAQDISLARSRLLPRIDLSFLGLQIDEDRAFKSAGQQAERTWSVGATLNQVLYAEPAWADLSIQKDLQRSREFDRDAFELDTAKEAATAYLNLLQAKTFERIQKENLSRTRRSLELAQIRETIGTAGPAEVLRWQSKLADNRKTVIESNADRNLAEIELNRLLNRPAEEPFRTADVDLTDPDLLLSQGRLLEYMRNPWDFKLLRTFMVREGVEGTPEIDALERAIAAQERAATSASRSFWLPSFAAIVDVAYVLGREGTGSDPVDTGLLPPELLPVFGPPEDLTWSVGLTASYSLEGGAKLARRRQAVAASAELRIELASTTQLVEQRVRSAMHSMGASYAGIEQSRLSADAAHESLELVEDAYGRGAATIIDLLDAQNNALVADLTAANAVYAFLVDLIETERAIGRLVLQMTSAERDEFFGRLDRFFAEARAQGR